MLLCALHKTGGASVQLSTPAPRNGGFPFWRGSLGETLSPKTLPPLATGAAASKGIDAGVAMAAFLGALSYKIMGCLLRRCTLL